MIGSSVIGAQSAFMKALADLGKRDGVQINRVSSRIGGHRPVARSARHRHETHRAVDDAATEHHRNELDITRFGRPQDVAGLVAFIVSPRGRWLHAPASISTAARSIRCACRATTERRSARVSSRPTAINKESAMTRPLSGIRVLELGNPYQPVCGRAPRRHGRGAVKIEPRRVGDMIRNTSPHLLTKSQLHRDQSQQAQSRNRSSSRQRAATSF